MSITNLATVKPSRILNYGNCQVTLSTYNLIKDFKTKHIYLDNCVDYYKPTYIMFHVEHVEIGVTLDTTINAIVRKLKKIGNKDAVIYKCEFEVYACWENGDIKQHVKNPIYF